MAMETDKSINDLPPALIQEILLRLPVKCLLLLRCVCKTWLYLISDPNFAKSQFELAAAEPTRRYLFIRSFDALSYDLDALFRDGHAAVKVSVPCTNPSTIDVLGSCRGFVLLDDCRRLIIWNPSTGAHKRIPYPRVVSLSKAQRFQLIRNVGFLYGFGYDASKDDYLVVLGWRDNNKENHFDFFSMRTNSWKKFEVALPNPQMGYVQRRGLFLNGAFHWLAGRDFPIVVFDLKERSFSDIPLPEHVAINNPRRLIELEGCLALYFWNSEGKLEIHVMKEYKVQSSWTLYGIFHRGFIPISLSRDGDITGYDAMTRTFSKYNDSRQKLEYSSCQLYQYSRCTMYTESLLSLPKYSKGKKKGCQVRQECFEQLDAVTNNNNNEVKETKRIRSAPTWTLDF